MEEIAKRQARIRRRFRALVRRVIANRSWLMELPAASMPTTKSRVHMLSKTRGKKSILELKHKALLNKPAEDRTEQEKMIIYKTIGGFKCFKKYPEHVKMKLAGCTYFAYFNADRVIVRQNHISQALYFIISGEVSVSNETWHPLLQRYESNITGTLTTDDMFGEASLLYELRRQYTITTITPVEFLILYRDDFNVVLKDIIQTEWDSILVSLNRFTYFDSWDDIVKKECCMVSNIKNFKKDETVFGDGAGARNWVYFILKGKCMMIEHLFVHQNNAYPNKYKLHDAKMDSFLPENKFVTAQKSELNANAATLKSQTLIARVATSSYELPTSNNSVFVSSHAETRFMQVCIFSEKACFNIGEPMVRRRVVAMTDVQCLLIPRYWLLTRGPANLWKRIQIYLQNHIPNTEELFSEFKEQREWRQFRENLVKSKIKKQPCNTPQNVPYSIRMREDFAYKCL